MTWEQKFEALKAFGGSYARIEMRRPGDWYCAPGGELAGDGMLRGEYGNGRTPEEAVNNCWACIERTPLDRYWRSSSSNKNFRWNGYMWQEVQP